MPIRNTQPFSWRPRGVSDTLDASNAFPGAMAQLANLVPDPSTPDMWMPRPAAVRLTAFAGFTTPGFVSALLVVGNLAYGLVASGRNAGKDEPFVYNLLTNTFLTVAGIKSTNTPTSPVTTGAWTPPSMAVVGTRIVVTHSGFAGGATKFGWFDISSFSSTTITGSTTNGSASVTALSSNALQAGYQPGQTITGAGIPASTTIVSVAADGLSLVMSANATATAAGVALTVAGGTAAAPLWGAGDTNLNNLPSTPVAVQQFNGRAYYACGNGVVFSDSLLACAVTNASQALTFANGLPVTALGALPLNSTTQGGIIQSIIAFQGVTAMVQITGDAATSTLTVNTLNAATGTLSPNSIVSINVGLAFMSPEGLRVIDFSAHVTDPIGDHGTGVTVPFINALYPSRTAAAANADTIRFSVQNAALSGQPTQEWWFDITRKVWSGPHSFPAGLIESWGQSFVMAPTGITGSLWQSDAVVSSASVYTENGAAMACTYQTPLLPDNGATAMNSVVESALSIAIPVSGAVGVSVVDDEGDTLDTVILSPLGSGAASWGSFNWGAGVWSSSGTAVPLQRRIPWHNPLVFKQMQITVTFTAASGYRLSNLYAPVQQLGYNLDIAV